MPDLNWLQDATPAFRLAMATSWLAPEPWQRNQEEDIGQAIDSGPDWGEYLSLVNRHQIQAVSWAALSRVQVIPVPDTVKQELESRTRSCRILGVQRSLVLAEVLGEFNRAGIPAMPLKGPVLSFELYGDVGLRASDDVDVQVPAEDLRRAMDCLESAGWRPGFDFRAMTPRQWQSFQRNDYEMLFTRAGCSLELHWRNHWETPDATSARWARSTAALWQGHSIRMMSGGDLALFLCVHGAFHIWCCAKWLGDVARAHSIGRLDWGAAMNLARSLGLEGVCPAAQSLLHSLYRLEVPILPGMGAGGGAARPSPLLVAMPLECLKLSDDPRGREGVALLRNHTHMIRYERLVHPGKAWWKTLAGLFYCQRDFRMIPLPDALFWLYKPLRPILWMWRWAQQAEAA